MKERKDNMANETKTASMDNSTLRIHSYYDNMGMAERKVADWILKHRDESIKLSIVELAGKTGASEATIARFARKLGYGGYQEMKIAFAQDESRGYKPTHESVKKADTCSKIFDKVIGDVDETLMHTRAVLSDKKLEAAAEAIHNAKKLLVIGLGASASVAMDAAHKFLREGVDCTYSSDNHMQVILASHLTEKDVVLAISHSGSSKDIIEAMEVAKSCGATTISISNYGRTPIDKVSDIELNTAADETKFTMLALSSRIAQLCIIDTLYLYVVMRRDKAAANAIAKVEKALETKKVEK